MTETVTLLRQRLQQHPMAVPLYSLIGAALYINKQPRGAVLCMRRALLLGATANQMNATIQRCRPREDQPAELARLRGVTGAERFDEQAIHLNLARALLVTKDLPSAERHLRIAIAADPRSEIAIGLLGQVLYQTQRYEEGRDTLLYGTTLHPGNPNIWSELGNSLRIINAKQQAAEAYSVALQLEPSVAAFQYNLGITLFDLQRPSQGDNRRTIDLLKRVSPASVDSFRQLERAIILGAALWREGKHAEGREAWRTQRGAGVLLALTLDGPREERSEALRRVLRTEAERRDNDDAFQLAVGLVNLILDSPGWDTLHDKVK